MRQLLTFVLKAAVSGVLLSFAFARVNFHLIGERLDRIDYMWLALAGLIFIAQTILGALRWQRIVLHNDTPDAPPFTIPRAFRYTFIAAFFNQTLPSTVGGDAVRIWLLRRDQGGWRAATYSVLIDRLTGVLVLALLVILCLPWSFALIRAFTEKTESRGSPAGTNRIQGSCWSGGQHGWRNRIRRICVGALLVRGKMALPSRKLRSNLE
jgi:glycosyltransferase 2 family protein